MTGIELAKLIRRTNRDVAIVFATNLQEYAIAGYSVDAMQYLLKPVRKEDCFSCLNSAYQRHKDGQKYFVFNDIDKTIRIDLF